METFSALLAICAGNSPATGEFPMQMPVMQSYDIFFDLLLNNRCRKQWWAGDLRHHRTHYDTTVMVHPKHYAHNCALFILLGFDTDRLTHILYLYGGFSGTGTQMRLTEWPWNSQFLKMEIVGLGIDSWTCQIYLSLALCSNMIKEWVLPLQYPTICFW